MFPRTGDPHHNGATLRPNGSPRWNLTTTKRHTSGVTSAVGTSGTAITSRVHSLNRPNMVSVGTIVWLSSELMFFAGLFAFYFTARAQAAGNWPPPPTELNLYQAVPEVEREQSSKEHQ